MAPSERIDVPMILISGPGYKVSEDEHETIMVPSTFESRSRSLSVGGGSMLSRQNDYYLDPSVLQPDPGTESDFVVDDNSFAFSPGQLSKLLNPKSLPAFYALGGIKGLEKGLRTDLTAGLSQDESVLEGKVTFEEATGHIRPSYTAPRSRSFHASNPRDGLQNFRDRKRVFSDNRLPQKKCKSFLQLAWIAFMDKLLLSLTAAAVILLAVGLYHTFGVKHPSEKPPCDWKDAIAILMAVGIVVGVGAATDHQKERHFVRLNKKKEDRSVKVIRSGKSLEISVYDLLVGDVTHLEPGDLVPADGIFILGHNVKCDESSATGESDMMKKTPAEEVMKQQQAGTASSKLDPFIISGSKVLEGVGTFMVTGVGKHSSYGKVMLSFHEYNPTPLQMKLNSLAEAIAKYGAVASCVLLSAMLLRYFLLVKDSADNVEILRVLVRIMIVALSFAVVAIPEGLPLFGSMLLSLFTIRMLKDNNLVRVLRACETMGNTTTVVTHTGTLTQNSMSVVAGTIGTSDNFDQRDDMNAIDNSATSFTEDLPSHLLDLLRQSIVLNTTAFEGEEDESPIFVGSKTETALLEFGRAYLGLGRLAEERSNADIIDLIPFDSSRKSMGIVVRLSDGRFRLFVKGAPEVVLDSCSRIINAEAKTLPDTTLTLTDDNIRGISGAINSYANECLRTIGFAYRDFDSRLVIRNADDEPHLDNLLEDLTWLGVFGLHDPLRPSASEAIMACQRAGVFVRMVTGENLVTAKAIAEDCGIYTPGGIVMEGSKFRQFTPAQMDQVIPRLQVLARSSIDDKRILIRKLKALGETVAVTGDYANDGLALADVGFSMGIAGTEVAKEASSIILMDDNFSSIVNAIMWGRTINDAVRKFLQFELAGKLSVAVITFVTALTSPDSSSAFTAVQLLWVNLIMDTFAALTFATNPPSSNILDRKPPPKSKSPPLISFPMGKMIVGQATYQLVVILVLHFCGLRILSYPADDVHKQELRTLIFNTFVWMQLFNHFDQNSDNASGFFSVNWHRVFINLVIIGGQVLAISVGGPALSVVPLSLVQWGITFLLGAFTIPVATIIRSIPTPFPLKPEPLVFGSREDRFEWNKGIEEIREELNFLKFVRGGRLHGIFANRRMSVVQNERLQRLYYAGLYHDVPSSSSNLAALIASNNYNVDIDVEDPPPSARLIRAFIAMSTSGLFLIPLGMASEKKPQAIWAVFGGYIVWITACGVLVISNMASSTTTHSFSAYLLLYVVSIFISLCFPSLVMGVPAERLFVWFPMFVNIGIIIALGVESIWGWCMDKVEAGIEFSTRVFEVVADRRRGPYHPIGAADQV